MGRKPKEVFLPCGFCHKEMSPKEFYNSSSMFYKDTGKMPYCKACMEKIYQHYLRIYREDIECEYPEEKALKRLCMILDAYFDEKLFLNTFTKYQENPKTSMVSSYFRRIPLEQFKGKTYDDTIAEEDKIKREAEKQARIDKASKDAIEDVEITDKTKEFFGAGFKDEDYIFLKREYDDWTARHECKTKAQEEVFKDICFNRLQNWRALQRGEDTKDITMSFQRLLDSGKLQPKQNSGDTMADNQTFGTLIDKWENTRPIPEIEEELRDVDKIGLYIDTFYRGHLAKMMGIKNAYSSLYSRFMKKYTIEKPEYDADEDSEALFDAIFGGGVSDE